MRTAGAVAFTATVCVLVPAATLHLTAGPAQEAKLVAPGASSFVIDGGRIDAKLDRAVVDPGGTVHVTLAAERAARVGIVVLGSTGTEGGRVPDPPIGVAYRQVTLAAGAPKDVALRLSGARGGWSGWYGTYTIYVTSARAAERLERLRRRAQPPVYNDEGPPDYGPGAQQLEEAISELDTDGKDGAPASVARLEAYAPPKSKRVAVALPDAALRGSDVTVGVTITNPSQKPMRGLEVTAELAPITDGDLGLTDEQVTITGDKTRIDLAGRETRRLEVHLKSETVGTLGLHVVARCTEVEPCTDSDELRSGTFEAIDIVAPPLLTANP